MFISKVLCYSLGMLLLEGGDIQEFLHMPDPFLPDYLYLLVIITTCLVSDLPTNGNYTENELSENSQGNNGY